MIAAIKARSADAGGRVAYLFGRDKAGLHRDAHTVAGPCHGVDRDHLASELGAYQQAWSKPGDQTVHMVLSAAPGDGRLSDQRWREIADEYMHAMGYDGARWVAVNHGLNAAGADHIHIVANRTLPDGRLVKDSNERRNAQRVTATIEQKHGLQVTEGRHSGVSPVPLTQGEMHKARDTGTEPERVSMARAVRAAANVATGEAEFVRLLRADPAVPEIRPRVQSGKVTGYSVVGPSGCPYQGGRLGRDLSIVRLRERWGGTDASEADWSRPGPVPGVSTADSSVRGVLEQMRATGDRLAGAGAAEHAAISAELSGACAVAAKATTRPQLAREWARRSTVAGQRAQTVRSGGPVRRSTGLSGAAMLINAMTGDDQAAVRLALMAALDAVYRLHQQAQAGRARDVRRLTVPPDAPAVAPVPVLTAEQVVRNVESRHAAPVPVLPPPLTPVPRPITRGGYSR